LFDLIRFCFSILWLKIEDFFDCIFCENVMIAFYPLNKSRLLSKAHNDSNDTFASEIRINIFWYSFSSLLMTQYYHFRFFLPRVLSPSLEFPSFS